MANNYQKNQFRAEGKRDALDRVDEILQSWEAHYRKMGDKPGDNVPDRARQFLCEELRKEIAFLRTP